MIEEQTENTEDIGTFEHYARHHPESDLSGQDLSGKDLRWINFTDSDFSGANLQNTDLRWADLRNSDFSNADLTGAKLFQAKMFDVCLDGAKIDEDEFNKALR